MKKYSIVIAILVILAILVTLAVDYKPNEVKAEYEPNMDVTEELSVQPKETIMFPVHEMTEEEMQEQLYDDSLEMLAICVEAEAGNQDLMGKRLVVDVILNRVDSDKFPDDIVSVITQTNQFSSYSDGHMDGIYEPSEETFRAVRMEL